MAASTTRKTQTLGDGSSPASRGTPVPTDAPDGSSTRDVPQPPSPDEPKSMLLALLLSFLFPGLGQYYAGRKRRGRWFIIAGVVFLVAILIEIGFILYPITWLYSMIDTFRTVRKVNAGVSSRAPRVSESLLVSVPCR